MKLQAGALIFDKSSAIDNLLALMLVDAQCDEGAVCVVFLEDGSQCVIKKEEKDGKAEFSYRDFRAGGPVVVGGYQTVDSEDGVQKQWFCQKPAVVRLEVGEHFVQSQFWNDRVLGIMTSLLGKMEVLSKTTKAGVRSLY